MVGASYDQKPYRRAMMETWGATVHRSPSDTTEAGRARPRTRPARWGSRSPRRSRSRPATPTPTTRSARCSTTCCLHQTVIGQEAIAQMELAGEEPDVVIGCVGGGSNFAGLAFPFVRRVLRGEATTRFVAAEPAACPTLTRGAYRYDFGDTVGLTPLMPMYTLGHDFVPPPMHAGGLRYHGDAPMLCGLVKAGLVEARAYRRTRRSRRRCASPAREGIIPAPEPAHAIRAVIEEAEAAREAGEERVILFGLCGHGHFDLSAYEAYLAGKLEDPEFSEADMEAALERLPDAPGDRLAAPLALALPRLGRRGRPGSPGAAAPAPAPPGLGVAGRARARGGSARCVGHGLGLARLPGRAAAAGPAAQEQRAQRRSQNAWTIGERRRAGSRTARRR